MNRRYAYKTQVPVSRSQAELRDCMERYGAYGFSCGWEGGFDCIGFNHVGITFLVRMKIPKIGDVTDEAEHRRMWRALLLVVKAKLEAVASGISTIEREFMAWVQTANGQTIGDMLEPKLLEAGKSRRMLALPMPESSK